MMRKALTETLLRSALCAGVVCRVVAASPDPFDADARAATIAETAAADAPYLVRLESRVFLPRGRADVAAMVNDKIFVQFKRTLTIEEQAALEAGGVVFHESFEPFTYLVSATPEAVATLQSDPLFLGAEPIRAEDKVTVSIFRDEVPAHARRPGGEIAVFFRFYENVTAAQAVAALAAAGVTVSDGSSFLFGNRLAAVTTRGRILAACAASVVRAAFEIPPTPVVSNVQAAGISNVPPVNAAPYGLNGSGVAVGIWDEGQVRATHFDLSPRVTNRESAHPISDHSTHVTGTLIGTGFSFAASKGMASSATAFSYDFDGDIPTEQWNASMPAPAGDGIVLTNNSWVVPSGWYFYCPDQYCSGPDDPLCSYYWIGDTFGSYNATSATYDDLVRRGRLTFVKAAGNEGTECGPEDCSAPRNNDCDGVLRSDGFRYDNIDEIGSAKNVLTVGAVRDDGVTKTDFSSCGPAKDGRIKPDVVANGEVLFSTGGQVDNHHMAMSGTSMAAPVVSGVVALIDEEWRNLHLSRSSAVNRPAPELVKALLIDTALDLGRPGPDYAYGHGLVRAKEAIDQLQAPNAAGSALLPPNQVRTAFIGEGELLSFRLLTPAGPTGLIRTAVAWDDLPGTSASVTRYCNYINLKVPCTSNADCIYGGECNPAPCGSVPCNLKNDLDTLLYNAPADRLIALPWIPPGYASMTDNAGMYLNHVDNVEAMWTSDPDGGALLFTVFGFTVTGGQQRFTLAANQPITFLPPNDNFANARVLPALLPADSAATGCASGQVPCPATLYPHNTWEGVNFDATMELGEPAGIPGAGHSVWYTWVAPANGQATFDTAGADFDTMLDVWTGSGYGALSFVASSDDFYGKQSQISFSAVAGTTYRVRVWGRFPPGATQNDSMGIFPLNYYLIVCGNGVIEPGEGCDDGNASNGDCCTTACTLAPGGATCSVGGNLCAFGTCSGATCTGLTPVVCADGNACTDDACNPATGGCVFTNNAASCNDGNSCTTTDRCVAGVCAGGPPAAVPAGTPSVTFASKTQLTWPALAGATGYDAVKGSLGALRATAGDFTSSTTLCLADDQIITEIDDSDALAPGTGIYYLVRGTSCSGSGTYDTGSPRQVGSRDAEIDAAPITCATACSRGRCTAGPPMDAGCDGCTAAICASDPWCCASAWDHICIVEVRTFCGSLTCAESAGACGHTVCSTGPPLVPGCDDPPVDPSCVSTICAADPFCCNTQWDDICASEVGMCGWNCN